MGAVGGAKSVVHIHIGQIGQRLREGGVVFGLAGGKAGVFEDEHIAGLHGRHGRRHALAHHLIQLGHGAAEQFAQAHGDGVHSVLHISGRFGAAEVRAENQCRASIEQIVQRRQRRLNAGVVGHSNWLAGVFAVQRHIKVHPHQHFLPLYINVLNCFFHGSLSY